MGTVVQLKNRINNSYSELKNSVEEKLVLVEEKIKLKLFSLMNFIKKTFSIFFLITSITLLTYTIYRSEFYWNGLKNDYYLVYYVISFS